MAVATASGILGIGIAYALYKDGPKAAEKITRLLGPLRTAAKDKFYVDEIYDAVIVKPFNWLSKLVFALIDRILIDKVLIEGWALVVGLFGRLGRLVQNGDVQRYLLVMLLGGVAILWLASRQETGIAAEPDAPGSTVMKLRAELGQGLERTGSDVEWDFDNDGKKDETGSEVTHDFGAPGQYDVTIKVVDVFGETKTVKRTILVGGAE
jgi:hypothetical protein